jgi:hypothetical protein
MIVIQRHGLWDTTEDISLAIQPEPVEDVLQKPDEGNLQVRFCEVAHSNLGAITPKKRCAMSPTRQSTEKTATLRVRHSALLRRPRPLWSIFFVITQPPRRN